VGEGDIRASRKSKRIEISSNEKWQNGDRNSNNTRFKISSGQIEKKRTRFEIKILLNFI
jgi:hypothetical protein